MYFTDRIKLLRNSVFKYIIILNIILQELTELLTPISPVTHPNQSRHSHVISPQSINLE